MKPALCSLPARWVDPAENARSTSRAGLRRCLVHFNKPAWQRSGKVKWTVHFLGQCHIVDSFICKVRLETHTQRRQPVAVLRGFAQEVRVVEGHAVIE